MYRYLALYIFFLSLFSFLSLQLLQDLALPSTTSSSSPMLIGHSFGPLSSGLVGPGGSSNVNSNSAVVYRVVLSGGPCGGKTTAMVQLHVHYVVLLLCPFYIYIAFHSLYICHNLATVSVQGE